MISDDRAVASQFRVKLLTDVVRLEIVLWERIDTCLRREHDLSMAFFEALNCIDQSSDSGLRVGDISQALAITVGGASKLVDRIERVGLVRREADPEDGRASRVFVTEAGRRRLDAARSTCDAEMASVLDSVLSMDEQNCLHDDVSRLLDAVRNMPAP